MAKSLSPLELDSELIEKYGIIEDLDIETKLLLVNAQIDEFRKVMFRNRIDIVLSQNLINSPDEGLASKGTENDRTYRFTVKQMAQGLRTLVAYRDQLDKLLED